jgi:hypothetical protein
VEAVFNREKLVLINTMIAVGNPLGQVKLYFVGAFC